MTAFTLLGLLVFWAWCFEIGYGLIPAYCVVRALWSLMWIDLSVEREKPPEPPKSLLQSLQEWA